MDAVSEGARPLGRELFSRRAVKEGRTVVSIRGQEAGAGCRIEVDVFPVGGGGAAPLSLGPYGFESLDGAVDFVEEALLALEYLGCSIHSGADEPSLRAMADAS